MSEKITTDKQDTRLSLEQHIARALKRKRISQGYKISDVARIAELSQGMISKVENAQVSTSLDTLSRLCNAIDLPTAEPATTTFAIAVDAKRPSDRSGGGTQWCRDATREQRTVCCADRSGCADRW